MCFVTRPQSKAAYCKSAAPLNLDLGGSDDVSPLLGVGRNPFPEVSRRVCNHGRAQVYKTGIHLRIGKTFIGELVELVDDIGGRVLRRDEPEPVTRFVARKEF